MGYNIGAIISIGGDKEYQRALQGIRSAMTYVKAEANAVTSAFDKNDKSMVALTARNKALGAALDLQKKAIDEAKAALVRLDAQGIDPSSDAYQRMTANLNNAQAELNKTSTEIHANEQAMAQLQESAKAERVQKFAAALKNVGEVAGKVVVVGLKAVGTAMTAVGVAAIATGKAAYKTVSSFADAAGAIDDSAKKVGMSAEEYQKWTYAAKLGGMEAETLESAMIKQQKAFSDATEGSKTAAAAYKALGVDIKTIGNSGDAFNAVMGKLADMQDATRRNALANDLFGKSYAELAPLLAEGSAGMDAFRNEAVALGGVMSNSAVEAGAAYGDMVDRIKVQATGLKNTLAVSMLPTAQAIGVGVQEFLGVLTKSLSDGLQPGDVKTIGAWISEKLIEGLKTIKQYLPEVISLVSSTLSEMVGVVVATLPEDPTCAHGRCVSTHTGAGDGNHGERGTSCADDYHHGHAAGAIHT